MESFIFETASRRERLRKEMLSRGRGWYRGRVLGIQQAGNKVGT